MTRKISQKEIDHVEQFMAIEISYSKIVILPYADGVTFLGSLAKAELSDSSIHEISNEGKLNFSKQTLVSFDMATIPQRTYREAKMDLLLGLEPKPEDEDDD